MQCPFCAEEIKDTAVVCIHCGRDLSIPRPLIDKMKRVEERLAQLEVEHAVLAQAMERGGRDMQASAAVAAPLSGKSVTGLVVVTTAALLMAHYILIIRFDLPLVYLRLASILLPLIAGIAFHGLPRWNVGVAFIASFAVATASVTGMSAAVALIDAGPLLPQNSRDWNETLEYAASIFLGFWAGLLMTQWYFGWRSPSVIEKVSHSIVESAHLGHGAEIELLKVLKSVEAIIASIVTITVAAASVITGLSHILR